MVTKEKAKEILSKFKLVPRPIEADLYKKGKYQEFAVALSVLPRDKSIPIPEERKGPISMGAFRSGLQHACDKLKIRSGAIQKGKEILLFTRP